MKREIILKLLMIVLIIFVFTLTSNTQWYPKKFSMKCNNTSDFIEGEDWNLTNYLYLGDDFYIIKCSPPFGATLRMCDVSFGHITKINDDIIFTDSLTKYSFIGRYVNNVDIEIVSGIKLFKGRTFNYDKTQRIPFSKDVYLELFRTIINIDDTIRNIKKTKVKIKDGKFFKFPFTLEFKKPLYKLYFWGDLLSEGNFIQNRNILYLQDIDMNYPITLEIINKNTLKGLKIPVHSPVVYNPAAVHKPRNFIRKE